MSKQPDMAKAGQGGRLPLLQRLMEHIQRLLGRAWGWARAPLAARPMVRALWAARRALGGGVVFEGSRRAVLWGARYWREKAPSMPSTPCVWSIAFVYQGHMAMLTAGYELETDVATTALLRFGRVGSSDPQTFAFLKQLAVVVRALVESNEGVKPTPPSESRPLVLCVVAPGPADRELRPEDEEHAPGAWQTVRCDDVGIVCRGLWDPRATRLSAGAIAASCAWALEALERAAGSGHRLGRG
jgi:hypothetical protein